MFKLIISKYLKNTKIFIGTAITIMVSSMILLGCLALIWGSVTSSTKGIRFANVDAVISPSEAVVLEVKEKDGDIDTEVEYLRESRPLLQEEIRQITSHVTENLHANVIPDQLLDVALTMGEYRINSIIVHNFSSMELTGFTSASTELKTNEVVVDEMFAAHYHLAVGGSLVVHFGDKQYATTIKDIVTHINPQVYETHNFVYLSDNLMHELGAKTYNLGVQTEQVGVLSKLYAGRYDIFLGDHVHDGEIAPFTRDYVSQMVAIITMASICLLASIFVLQGTIAFSVKHRQREFGMLRILGLSKFQLHTMLLIETFPVYIVAFGLGHALSLPFAHLIKELYIRINLFDRYYVPEANGYMVLLTFVGLLLVVNLVAIFVGSKVLKTSPMQAMKQENIEHKRGKVFRIIMGFLLFGGALAIIMATPYYSGIGIGMGFIACGLMLGGFLLAAPLVMRVFNYLLSIFTRNMYGSLGQVAKSNIQEKASKFAIASISLALMFSLNSVMFLNNATFIEYNSTAQYKMFQAYNYYTNQVPTHLTREDLLVVKRANLIYKTEALDDMQDVSATGVSDFSHLHIAVQGRYPKKANEIIISSQFKPAHIDTILYLVLPDGTEKPYRVVGTFDSLADTKELVMYVHDIMQHSFSKTYSAAYTTSEALPKQDAIQLGFQEHTAESYQNSIEYDVQMGALILMIVVSFMLTVIGLFNTFAMIMTVRKKEFNLLRLIGANKHQIIAMTLIETAIVTITGVMIGLVIHILCVAPYSMHMHGGFDVVVHADMFYGILGTVVVLGILAGIIPSIVTCQALSDDSGRSNF